VQGILEAAALADLKKKRVKAAPAREPALKPGQTVNLRALADYLHLSPATVSLVLNNSPAGKAISQGTRERVIAAAAKLNYRPNYIARSLRQSKTFSVGVLTPDLSEGYFTLVMKGIDEQLTRSNYVYLTSIHHSDEDLIEKYPLALMSRSVDGFLFLNTSSIAQLPLPLVAISGPRAVAGVTNIVVDHHQAAEMALGHLYSLGHRRVAVMHGPPQRPDAEYRWRGYLQAAREMGISIPPEGRIELKDLASSPEPACIAVRDLLARFRGFTALVCWNDISAIGAVSAIREAGLSVPRDISVLGFDDIISAGYQTPKLTTVRQPLEDMGRQGAEILLQKIARPQDEYPSEIVARAELVVRESTGPARR
jgi:DNA-binding LacI/PurR family transcriptional regulator